MADIFDKWDSAVDTEGLAKDVAEAAQSNTGNYEDVPHGTYEVSVNKMEVKASKKGDPMVTIWFKVVSDDHKGGMIFFNQVITQGFQIHIVDEMLRKLSDNQADVKFENYKQYNQLILDVFEITGGFEYGLKYTANAKNKDFSNYEITDVFALED